MPAELADEVARGARAPGRDGRRERTTSCSRSISRAASSRDDELARGPARGRSRGGKFLPVLCGAGAQGIGAHALLDAVVDLLPSPGRAAGVGGRRSADAASDVERAADPAAPFSAFVFKTIVDPFAGKLSRVARRLRARRAATSTSSTRTATARERLGHLLQARGQEADPGAAARSRATSSRVAKLKDTAPGDTLCDEKRAGRLPAAARRRRPVISFALAAEEQGRRGQDHAGPAPADGGGPGAARRIATSRPRRFVVSGMGQLHVEVTVERLKRKFGVEVELKAPKVPYKETIRGKRARRRASTRSRPAATASTATAGSRSTPLPRGGGFEFVDEIVGGVIPRNSSRRWRRASASCCRTASSPAIRWSTCEVTLVRRLVPRRRLVGDGVQDRRVDGLQEGVRAGASRCCSSRS